MLTDAKSDKIQHLLLIKNVTNKIQIKRCFIKVAASIIFDGQTLQPFLL